MSMGINVTVTTVGNSTTVEIDEPNVAAALAQAGVDAEQQGLDIEVDGGSATVSTEVTDGSQVLATPRAPKLG